jgi:hypothetical protein
MNVLRNELNVKESKTWKQEMNSTKAAIAKSIEEC